jgi:hypothetical protein
MPHYENARRISFVSFFAGLMCFIFVLALQSSDPAGFINTVFGFSQSTRSPASDATSAFAFWASAAMLVLGALGILFFAIFTDRTRETERREVAAQYDCADKGEENWIFI